MENEYFMESFYDKDPYRNAGLLYATYVDHPNSEQGAIEKKVRKVVYSYFKRGFILFEREFNEILKELENLVDRLCEENKRANKPSVSVYDNACNDNKYMYIDNHVLIKFDKVVHLYTKEENTWIQI